MDCKQIISLIGVLVIVLGVALFGLSWWMLDGQFDQGGIIVRFFPDDYVICGIVIDPESFWENSGIVGVGITVVGGLCVIAGGTAR